MNSRISSRIFLFIVADALNIKKHTSTILLINTKFCNYTLNFRNNNSFNRTIIELRQRLVGIIIISELRF